MTICKERRCRKAASVPVIAPRYVGLLCCQQPVKYFDYRYLTVANNLPYGVLYTVQAAKEDVGDGRPYFPPLYLDGVELRGI